MNSDEREMIKALPNRLLGIIIGVILVVNATPLGNAAPSEFQSILTTNMKLFGWIVIVLSFLKTAIDYWLRFTPEEESKKD